MTHEESSQNRPLLDPSPVEKGTDPVAPLLSRLRAAQDAYVAARVPAPGAAGGVDPLLDALDYLKGSLRDDDQSRAVARALLGLDGPEGALDKAARDFLAAYDDRHMTWEILWDLAGALRDAYGQSAG